MKLKHAVFVFCVLPSYAFCAKAIFSLTQVIAPPSKLITGRVANAFYQVTNNTPITLKDISVHNLPANVVQDPVGNGLSPQGLITCRTKFDLAPNASCLLKLKISGSVSSGPKVCQNGSSDNPAFCSTPELASNVLNVENVAETATTPTISISPSTFTLNTGSFVSVTVTNNSTETVNNIKANFVGTALEGKVDVVDIDYTGACQSLATGSSCTLSLVSYQQNSVANTNFIISGSNTKSVSASANIAYEPPSAIYTATMDDNLYHADMWANTPYIMSAHYAFTGQTGTTKGEQHVITSGNAWNVIYTPGAAYAVQTNAADVSSMSSSFGYPAYYNGAMPLCFSWPVLPSSVNPSSFKVTLNTGKEVYPNVLSLYPNNLYNERACLIAVGNFGNRIPAGEEGAVYPTMVTIVNNGYDFKLVGPSGPVSIVGQSISTGAHPYTTNGGSILLAAKLSVMNAEGQCAPNFYNSSFPSDGIALYGASKAQYRLRMFTNGGFAPGNFIPSVTRSPSLMPTDYNNFFQIKVVANGQTTWLYQDNKTYIIPGYGEITISGLASLDNVATPLNDAYQGVQNNNQIDVVLYGDLAAIEKITEIVIPAEGTNPEIGTPYLKQYNPGGPGNNPTPGVFYSQPGPPVTMPVTNALSDPKTVNLNMTTDPC